MTGGQVSLPLVDPHGQRRRPALRRAALAGGRELGHGGPRIESRRALDPGRRDGALGGGDSRSRSGAVLRSQRALSAARRGSRRRASSTSSGRPRCCAAAKTHDPGPRRDGPARARGGRAARGPRTTSKSRSSTCARWSRSIRRRSCARRSATGRLYTVEENPRLCGWGAEIASIVAEEAFWDLDGPIVRITTPHVPLPAAEALEDGARPSVQRIVTTVRNTLG